MKPTHTIRSFIPFVIFSIVFPERPGATQKFLAGLESEWNVSLFHYRNHGDGKCIIILEKEIAFACLYTWQVANLSSTVTSDMGKVLVGIQVPPEDNSAFDRYLEELGYNYVEETNNVVYETFLRA